MKGSRDHTLVKWVCNECGSNNLCHVAVIHQCMVCNKIRTTEPLIIVNRDKVIEPTASHAKTSLNTYTLDEYFIIIIERIIQYVSKALVSILVFLIIFYAFLFLASNDSLNDILYNMQGNLQSLENGMNLEHFEAIVKQWHSCCIEKLANIHSNTLTLNKECHYFKSDSLNIIWISLKNRCMNGLRNNQLLQNGLIQKWMNALSIWPFIVIHVRKLISGSKPVSLFKKMYLKIIGKKRW